MGIGAAVQSGAVVLALIFAAWIFRYAVKGIRADQKKKDEADRQEGMREIAKKAYNAPSTIDEHWTVSVRGKWQVRDPETGDDVRVEQPTAGSENARRKDS